MLLSVLKILLLISVLAFSLLLIFHKQFTLRVKDNVKISNFVATMAFFLVAYIIFAILLGFILDNTAYKILMFIFALSPFIVGKMATYNKIRLFSSLQVIVMILSAVVVYLR